MSAGRKSQWSEVPSDIHRLFYGADPGREIKMKARERQKFCPQLDRAIYAKKYILPTYRQADYHPQDVANKMFASAILIPMQTDDYDGVANAAICNALQALKVNRPTLYLERELGEAFMRTQLPGDMIAEDVHWRWPGMRIFIPKGLLTLAAEDTQVSHDMMFLDVCDLPVGTELTVPQPYADEILALAREYGWPNPGRALGFSTTPYAQRALMISGNLDGSPDGVLTLEQMNQGDYMLYAVVKPFDSAVRLGQIRRIDHNVDKQLSSPYESSDTDDRFCEKILHLALNILLFLGSMPAEYQPETVLRKPRLEGSHALPGLYAARFVGRSQLRPDRAKSAHRADSALPGRHLAAHWRCGHWKRQAFGPGRAERKYIWLQPYQTGEPDEKPDLK
jgi:hypothetical protein